MKQPSAAGALAKTRLGGYEVRSLLGAGGMAEVYLGYDTALDREVAIKVISTVGQDADFVSRFQREARVVARLRHPNIVQIYHFGDQDGIVYMVQELLPGPTLEGRIREMGRRRMAAERVTQIIDQLAGALDFAHSQGVIHRDVKPSNALYNAQGELVLTDFGIARSETDTNHTVTGPGVVMGTPGYVAPEQAVGGATLTSACDIYALGVVLFELLVGRLPFEADSSLGVLLKHLYDEPPVPSSVRADLPEAVDAVVLRALRKEPGERYPSAGALAQALRAAWPGGRSAGSGSRARSAPKAASPAAPAAPARSTPKASAAGGAAARKPKAADTPKVADTPKSAATPRDTPAPRAPARTATPTPKPAAMPAPKLATPAPRPVATTPKPATPAASANGARKPAGQAKPRRKSNWLLRTLLILPILLVIALVAATLLVPDMLPPDISRATTPVVSKAWETIQNLWARMQGATS